jgi:hypothetical protein
MTHNSLGFTLLPREPEIGLDPGRLRPRNFATAFQPRTYKDAKGIGWFQKPLRVIQERIYRQRTVLKRTSVRKSTSETPGPGLGFCTRNPYTNPVHLSNEKALNAR